MGRKKIKGNEAKNKFRRSKRWRDFRKRLIEERGSYCEACGKKTKLLQCHHMDESIEHYEDLSDPSRFKLLCSQCHKCTESLAAIKPENWYRIRNKDWVDFYKKFLIITG